MLEYASNSSRLKENISTPQVELETSQIQINLKHQINSTDGLFCYLNQKKNQK